jgi:hypothetical protein
MSARKVPKPPFLMNDTSAYPVCIEDTDCKQTHKLKDYVCFQYFCYPWKTESGIVSRKREKDKKANETAISWRATRGAE